MFCIFGLNVVPYCSLVTLSEKKSKKSDYIQNPTIIFLCSKADRYNIKLKSIYHGITVLFLYIFHDGNIFYVQMRVNLLNFLFLVFTKPFREPDSEKIILQSIFDLHLFL